MRDKQQGDLGEVAIHVHCHGAHLFIELSNTDRAVDLADPAHACCAEARVRRDNLTNKTNQ